MIHESSSNAVEKFRFQTLRGTYYFICPCILDRHLDHLVHFSAKRANASVSSRRHVTPCPFVLSPPYHRPTLILEQSPAISAQAFVGDFGTGILPITSSQHILCRKRVWSCLACLRLVVVIAQPVLSRLGAFSSTPFN